MRERAPFDRSLGAVVFAVAMTIGCADTVRPIMGGLKIGGATDGPFVMPMLESEGTPFEYPRGAWLRGVGGETILKIHISGTGVVDTVAIAESSGDATLDSAAVAGAHKLRYRPAQQGDVAMSVWAYLPVRYPMPAPAKDGGGYR